MESTLRKPLNKLSLIREVGWLSPALISWEPLIPGIYKEVLEKVQQMLRSKVRPERTLSQTESTPAPLR
jgi:hypothetical protein